jgi:hypothetical protein
MACNKTYNIVFGAINCDGSTLSTDNLESSYNWDCTGCDNVPNPYQQYILGDCNLDGVLDENDTTECMYIANCTNPVDWMANCGNDDPSQWDITDFTMQACACDVTGNDGMSQSDTSRISICESGNGSCQSRSSGTCQGLSSMGTCTIGEICDIFIEA